MKLNFSDVNENARCRNTAPLDFKVNCLQQQSQQMPCNCEQSKVQQMQQQFLQHQQQQQRQQQQQQQQQNIALQQQIALRNLQAHNLESLLLQEHLNSNPFKLKFHQDGQTDTLDLNAAMSSNSSF